MERRFIVAGVASVVLGVVLTFIDGETEEQSSGVCRATSNGSARLKSEPLRTIPAGGLIATSDQLEGMPNVKVVFRDVNEDCDAWRRRVGEKLLLSNK